MTVFQPHLLREQVIYFTEIVKRIEINIAGY